MSRETWKIIQSNEVDYVELQLALQCAPLIAGMKTSNLLNIDKEDFDKIAGIVMDSHISWYVLVETEKKMMILLYNKNSLERYFVQERVWKLLRQIGYVCSSLEGVLEEFRVRYRYYMNDKEDFPHEMGLFLGYPIEDVEGFIKYKGRCFLYIGYWKVYEDEDKKVKLFKRFEEAKERLIQLLFAGAHMEDIIRICGQHTERIAVQI